MDTHARPTRPRRRGARLLLAGLSLALLAALAPSAPSGAAATDSDTLLFVPFRGQTVGVVRNGVITKPAYISSEAPFVGDFTGEAGRTVFLYTPGSAPDGLLRVVPSGTGVTTAFTPKTVNGTFTPLVGDFDGNAIDDVIWYAPGTAPDAMWLFSSGGGHTSVPISINGTYRPVVMNLNGDGRDDVLWYAPGTAPDSAWLFGSGAAHTSKAMTINGTYELVPGYFGLRPEGSPQQRLLFFNRSGGDSIWTFDTSANHTSTSVPAIDGSHRPVVGRFMDTDTDAILWYRPGSASESFWSFTDGGAVNQLEPPSVYGSYDPAVGDLDGNGYQDIAWGSDGRATLWKFNGGGYTTATVDTHLPDTTPFVTLTGAF